VQQLYCLFSPCAWQIQASQVKFPLRVVRFALLYGSGLRFRPEILPKVAAPPANSLVNPQTIGHNQEEADILKPGGERAPLPFPVAGT